MDRNVLYRIILLSLPTAFARPNVMLQRQVDSTTTSTSTATTASSTSTHPAENSDALAGKTSKTIVIPLAVILGVLIILALAWVLRIRLFKKFAPQSTAREGITAEELASGRRSRSASTAALATAPGAGTGESVLNPSGRGARGRRARRGVRRTESGRSIRTLPEYRKEAGDEELVLVRQRSASSIEEEEDDDDEEDEDDEPDMASRETRPSRSDSVRSARSNRSIRSIRSQRVSGLGIRGSDAQEVSLEPSTPAPSGSQTAPVEQGRSRRTLSNVSRRGWGEAPTYLEAMSSPTYLDSTSPSLESGLGVPAPRAQSSLRTRTSSSFRELLNRAGLTFAPSAFRDGSNRHEMTQTSRHSSTSLLLQPQSSRISSVTSYTARTSREHSRETTASPMGSPWASTHSLQISSPVPNSAVRASFVGSSIPRAGLSDDQMRFLSSSEAVNLVGVKMEDVPATKKKRRKSVLGLEDDGTAPPSWDEVNAQVGRAGPSGTARAASPDVHHPDHPAENAHDSGVTMQTDNQPQAGARGLSISTSVSLPSTAATSVPPPLPSVTTTPPSVQVEPPTPHSPTTGPGWPMPKPMIATPDPAVVR